MGWCKEIMEHAEEHKLDTKKHLAAMAILVEMADEGYAANPSRWEGHREKVESLVFG